MSENNKLPRRTREIYSDEFERVIDYFLTADDTFLRGMGINPAKLPARESWLQMLLDDHARPLPERLFYYVIWELDGQAVGNSNINNIRYGQEATMHLHIWQPDLRRQGHGAFFVRESVAAYFENFHLQNLYCEPYALNPAPNRTLARVGFELQGSTVTTPGWISFEQEVNRWLLTREKWLSLQTN